MIKFVEGDFFDYEADIRVNTVNCVGVMGAGVAFAFKNKYPDMFNEYASLCKRGIISPGQPAVWRGFDVNLNELEIINFPTKDHWRNPSQYVYIEKGLAWLSEYLKHKTDKVITLPALGCGHGGLDWVIVKEMIQMSLSDNKNEILVFSPQSSNSIKRKKNEGSDNRYPTLKELNVYELHPNEKNYPVRLRRFTEKSLYFVGDLFFNYDFSIISSTNPSDYEKRAVLDFIEMAAVKKYSILFGGSVFDKRMAALSLSKGILAGVFLPSGIAVSAEKMNAREKLNGLSIFSLGNPFVQFNRSEYLPSVLSRIFISRKVIFTTSKLQWIRKYKKIILSNEIDSFYLISEASDSDIDAANLIKSKAVDIPGLFELI